MNTKERNRCVPTPSKPGGFRSLLAVTALCLWASVRVATGALSQQVVQQFFVPFPETDFKTSLQGIAGSTSVGTNLQTTLSIVVGTTNTIIVYDHWEDGYENDLNSPTQPNTQIWGDGILTNGVAPGYTNDFLPPGAVITLTNLVTLPRNPSVLRYDGRDRIGATRPVTLTRAGWSTAIGTLLASSAEVYDVSRFGTSFLIPVGTNTTPSVESFSYSSLHIVASQNGTVVKVDKNGDGLDDLTNTLNMGETLFVDGGVNVGATVSATKPIQVHELTGRINSSYQSRTFAIRPVEQWDTTYYAPVGTTTANNTHNVFLFNQYATNLTVLYSTRTATNSVTVPPKGNYKFAMPLNSGAKFYTTNNGRFYAVGCNDSGSTTAGNNQNFDWGYALLPAAALTPVVIVGWAPGSDDQNGTAGPDQNGSPVWVTPTKATTIYVNYAGNYDIGPLVAPNGHRYNTNYSLVAYQFQTIFNPTTRNMTGARIFTSDGTTFAAAWGEDANVASQGAPYLDAGTGIIPFPVPNIAKTSAMAVDQDGNGKLSWGDTLEYTIRVQNDGMLVLGNVLVLDALPPSLLYVTNSTTVNGTPVADNPVPPATSAFPLDEAGLILPQIQVSGFSEIKYRVTVAPGSTGISNSVLASAGGTVGTGDDTVQSTESVIAAPPVIVDFTDASGNPVSAYLINSGIYVTLTDLARNTNSTSAQSISVLVTNISNGDRELVTLTETGTNSGIFRNTSPLPSSISTGSGVTNGTLLALAGHNLTVAYTDPITANSDSATATIAAAPLPAVSKRSLLLIDQNNDGRIGWGDTVSYSIVLTNASGFAISNLVVRDTLPTNVTYVSSSTTSNGVSVADSGATPFPLDEAGFQISTLPSGSARTLSFQVVVTAGTVISNSVTATNAAGQVQAQDVATVLPPPPTCNLNFSDSVGNTLPLSQENAGIYATLVDTSKNTDSTTLQTATVTVTNLSTGDAESLVLTETGTNTGVFRNSAALPSATLGGISQGDGTLHTRSGDVISVLFAGPSSETCAGLATVIPAIQIKKLYLNADNAGDAYQNLDRVDPVAAGRTFTSNSVVLANGGSTTFAQTPPFCSPFFLPAGSTVAITNYFSVTSGVMPAAPAISATLRKGTNAASATNIISLTNPSTNSASLRWTATLPASITVNSGEMIYLVVTSAQSGVTFSLQYNSSSKPSVVALPTTTVITLDQFGVYDAAYPGGTLITNAGSGQTVYFRGTASDPFGSYDVTSLTLSILNPGGFTFATNLNAANVVSTNSCSKTFEYAWIAENWQGSHTIRATAYEGTEGITNSAQTSLQVSYPAGGTLSTTTFIDSTGTATNSYATNQSICMRVTDLNSNLNPATIETITVLLTSTTGDSETLTLSETGTNSGIFSGCINANTNNPSAGNGIINAAGGAGLTATYTDPTNPSDKSSDTAIVRTPPGPRPTVNIFKTLITPANGNILLGSTVQFDITVGNPGSVTVTNVTLADVFPSSRLQFATASISPDSTTPAGTLTWNNLGPLASGQSVTISTFFRAISAGALTNSASVTGTTNAGPALATALNTAPGIAVSKTLVSPNPGPAYINSNVVFRIAITNIGSTTINSYILQDQFSSACFQFLDATTTPSGSGGGLILWTGLGSLAPGASTVIFVTNKVTGTCSPALNTATISSAVDQNGTSVPSVQSSASIMNIGATMSGTVWYDANANATNDTGDSALSAVIVYADVNNNGIREGSEPFANTDTNGFYQITSLPGGNYTARVDTNSLLSGVRPTYDLDGTNTPHIVTLTVTNGQTLTGLDFGYIGSGSIGGYVWNDLNANGAKGATEPFLANIVLFIDYNGNGARDGNEPSLTTGPSGTYIFSNLVADSYRVAVDLASLPSGLRETYDLDGTNTLHVSTVLLAANQLVTNANFGYQGAASLSGVISDTLTGLPIPGVTVVVVDSLGATQTVTSDGTGNYSIPALWTGPAAITANRVGYGSANSSPTIVTGVNTQNLALTPNILTGVIRDSVTTLPIGGAIVTVVDSANVTNTIVTGAGGTYAVTNISIGAAAVTARKTGYTSASAAPVIVTGANTQDLNLTANTLTGQVTDSSTGLPISGATVTITDNSNVVHSVSTDVTGHYSVSNLPTGPTTVLAAKTGYSSATSTPTIVSGSNTQNALLTPNILTGVIRDDSTTLPIAGAIVTVIDNAGATNIVVTGAGGTYAVTNIATGSAVVSASKSGYTTASASPAIVVGTNTQDLNLIPNSLSGQVTDSLTGLPISGATVAATDSSNVVHTVTTDGTGHYGIATLPTGTTTVTASKTGYASTNSSLSIVSGTNTQNALLVPNILSGVVRDTSTALPITGALIVIIDNAGVTNSITSGVDGAYSVTNIATGSASVSASKAGYMPASTNLSIVVGANIQDLSLTPNTLTGQVTDSFTGLPISGASVTVTDSSNVVHTVSTDGTGHYAVSNLPTGATTVAASKSGYSSANESLTIVTGANIQNEVLTPNILSGVIRDTSTLLPITDATVVVVDNASVTTTITTGPDGSYAVTNIAIGAATVTASKSGYTSASANLLIVSGANVQDHNLTPTTLTGVVTDFLTGLPINGASVTVTDSANAVHTSTTDGLGQYAFSNLPTGATTVAASKTGYSSASASLNIVPGANTQNEVLTPNILSGVIRDSLTALAITGATVVVIDNANLTTTITTGPDGAYVVTNIATGAATVTASSSGFTPASANPVIVAGGNVQDINLTPTTLSGVITDSLTGLPISGATVSVTDSSNVVHTVSTDGTGYYSASRLPTGYATVTASMPGYSSASSSLSLVPGANTQNEALTPTTLTGVITDSGSYLPLPGATVIVVDATGTTNFLTTDVNGFYAVTNPATGPATLIATKSGYTPASATLTLVLGPNTHNLELASSNPTLAVISEVKAYACGSNVLVRWQTASEVGTVSFDLYRQSSSGWTKVNDEPVIAGNVTTGASYDVLDADAKPQSAAEYRIVELEEHGTTRTYGPYSLNATEPLPTPATKVAAKSAKTTAVAAVQSGGSAAKVASAKSSGGPAFVKIATTNTGIQYVTAAAVASALGQSTAAMQQQIAGGQFELSNQGFAVSYIPNADGSALSFYAETLKNNYTAQNIYFLTPGANAALPSIGGPPASSSAPATAYYKAQLNLEQDLLAVPTLVQDQAQDFWMWQRLVGGLSTFDTANIPLVVNHLSSGGDATARVTLQLLGGSEASHVVQVSVNGTIVGQDTWEGRAAHTSTLDIPASLLVEGTNRLSLKALRKVTTVTSQWYLNNISLEYQRQYFAQNGVLSFGANSNATITIDGFTSSAITVLDVSDAEQPMFVSGITTTPSASGFAASFSPADPQGRFVAFQSGTGTTPAALTSGQIVNLSGKQNAADYLIITPSIFADGATQLAGYRQQKGLRTLVVTLDQVYNEFSDGIATPYAIKQFLATATKQWSVKPRYVILIGDGTYDYRDLLQKHDNFVPPMLVATAYGLFCSDTAYGDFNNDGLPQIAIGRLPVKTADQLATMLNKIKSYEANAPAPNAQALLVSDVPDTAGDFADAIQQVNATLSGQYSNDVLKCTSQDNLTDVRKSIQSNLATGVDLFNYIGHGAIDRLGNSGYITSSDIAALQTANRLPLIVAVTCVAGQFSVPGSDCLAEKLALQSNGGAVAVIAPTGLSVNHDASRLNLRLMQLLNANEGPGLGDMFRQALADHVALDKPATEPAIYNLIGDPALTYNVASKLLVTAPQITSIVAGKDTLTITWSGGSAPYHVEMRSADTTWQEVGSATTGTTATIPMNGPLGFIRIRSGQ